MNDLLNYGYLSPPRHRATPSHFRLIHIPPNHAHRSLLAEQASDPLPVGEAPPHTSDRWTVCQIMVYLYATQCRGAYSSPTLPQLRIYPNACCTQRDRSRSPFQTVEKRMLFGSLKNAAIFTPHRGAKIFALLNARLAKQGSARQWIPFEAGAAPSSSPTAERIFASHKASIFRQTAKGPLTRSLFASFSRFSHAFLLFPCCSQHLFLGLFLHRFSVYPVIGIP